MTRCAVIPSVLNGLDCTTNSVVIGANTGSGEPETAWARR